MDRFFAALILGGRLHPNGIPEWGPWEASRLHWWPEDHLDLVLTTTRERKVRTTEGLEAAIKEPMTVAPTRNVWIHESLEDDARRLWEKSDVGGRSAQSIWSVIDQSMEEHGNAG